MMVTSLLLGAANSDCSYVYANLVLYRVCFSVWHRDGVYYLYRDVVMYRVGRTGLYLTGFRSILARSVEPRLYCVAGITVLHSTVSDYWYRLLLALIFHSRSVIEVSKYHGSFEKLNKDIGNSFRIIILEYSMCLSIFIHIILHYIQDQHEVK